MKKLFLVLFSFLFIGTAFTGSAFLFSGCDSSYSQESPNQDNIENGQNTEDDTGQDDDFESNEPDDTEDLAAWYYYAIRFCGTIVVADNDTTTWLINNIYDSFDDIGGEVSVTGGSSCQTPRISTKDWHDDMVEYGGIYIYFLTDIVNTSITMEVDSMPPGYTFVGWYRGYDTGEEILYEPLSTSSTSSTYYITVSGFFARGSTTNAAADACDDMVNCIFAAFAKADVLTIKYASQQATNSTSITLSATNGTLSTTSISSGGQATLTAKPDSSYKYVTISLSNDSSYDYYMRIGSAPTTSAYTMIYDSASDSYTYEWNTNTANPNITLNTYIKQRYTITYNSNTGSGSMSATYKIYGTAVNLRSNTFTKTGYHFSGWSLAMSQQP